MARTARDAPGAGAMRARALRLLARREHSRAELRRKLVRDAAEGHDVEALLDDLAARGWLSDARYAEQVVRTKASRFGAVRLAHYMREKGVDDDCVAEAIAQVRAGEAQAVEAAWRRRFGVPPADDSQRARQFRFLQGRGFSTTAIAELLRRLGPAR